MKTVCVGIIGTGMAGESHVKGYLAAGATVSVVYDPNPKNAKRLAEMTGARCAESLVDIVNADISAVSVCSPHPAHEEAAVLASNAGKHILMEKPLAVSVKSAQRIASAVKKNKVLFMMGMTHHWYPELLEARRLQKDGQIGNVYMALDKMVFSTKGFLPWVFEKSKSGGGVFLENGIHAVDRLCWFFDDRVAEVTASVGGYTMKTDTEDNGIAFLRFTRGGIAAIVQSVSPGDHLDCDLELFGTKGTIKINTWKGYSLSNSETSLTRQCRSSMINLWDGITEGIITEVADFIDCIKKNKTPSVSIDDGVHALSVVMAIYTASKTGKTVKIK